MKKRGIYGSKGKTGRNALLNTADGESNKRLEIGGGRNYLRGESLTGAIIISGKGYPDL